jgi:hypothetical protein
MIKIIKGCGCVSSSLHGKESHITGIVRILRHRNAPGNLGIVTHGLVVDAKRE